jgi:uncharacterized protein YndB with AHSA1/START domain
MKLNTGKLKVTLPSDCEVRLVRVFAAPRQLVFDANTKPEMLKRWLFGPDGWSMSVCEIDLRVGGKYRYVWRHQDGREFGTGGKFVVIAPPEKIVSTEQPDWAPGQGESFNTLEFAEKAGKTTVTLTMRFPSKEVRDAAIKSGMNEGIEVGYARLDTIFAASEPTAIKGGKRP